MKNPICRNWKSFLEEVTFRLGLEMIAKRFFGLTKG